MRFSIICGMALRDYWHERALSLCAVLALATVLAPLLILFGVRNGVISNLQERLLRYPDAHCRSWCLSALWSAHTHPSSRVILLICFAVIITLSVFRISTSAALEIPVT